MMPGRITAVMGPSGAGKTTFLSALAGKAHRCKITGSILINGKPGSIHSYKRIIGFVPQDDIVHGKLTVEENLWFSANYRYVVLVFGIQFYSDLVLVFLALEWVLYGSQPSFLTFFIKKYYRLPANMLKQDRVLVVERVIECLGLQRVRNSLVGTVEKRGISGGQRKLVNVGLEIVMEPSLLILDEPTSGLDSSSSQLLLRALRRETLEGINVSLMFDDLVLLAKGGLTVYHRSVREVEEYFSGLGINVPDRVNPLDYFIDVLEGMVKLNTSSGVTCEQLPVRWMLHKGYHVPPDMHANAAAMFPEGQLSSNELKDNEGAAEDHSFIGEIWECVKSNVKVRSDVIRHNFLRTKDLSNRSTPGILMQYRYFIGRFISC
ncbi:putative ABC-type sulfate transporter [Helianthus anomalus]